MLQTVNKEYVYRKLEDNTLTFYIKSRQQNEYGQLIEIDMDDLLELYNRERGTYYAKITFSIALQIFEKEPVTDFVAIFGNRQRVHGFRAQFTEVFWREKHTSEFPMFNVRFLLREREGCLRSEFPDMREISVDNVRDIYVRRAVIKGSFLEQSPEYSKYILSEEIGGTVRHFGISVRDFLKERVIILSSDGTIYTRMGRASIEIDTVYMVLCKLEKCDALRISTLRKAYRTINTYI